MARVHSETASITLRRARGDRIITGVVLNRHEETWQGDRVLSLRVRVEGDAASARPEISPDWGELVRQRATECVTDFIKEREATSETG